MPVPQAELSRITDDNSTPYPAEPPWAPSQTQALLVSYDFVEEEYLATGRVDGQSYATAVLIRRPSDDGAFSGHVIVDPVHSMGGAGEWKALQEHIVRSGHGYMRVTSHKSALDRLLEYDNDRYSMCGIELPKDLDAVWKSAASHGWLDRWLHGQTTHDPETVREVLQEMMRLVISETPTANGILAQVGAAMKGGAWEGTFTKTTVRNLFLGGHSLTGLAVLGYISDAHDDAKLADGSAIYDGFFPSGTGATHRATVDLDEGLPAIDGFDEPVRGSDSPVVHILTEGDVALGLGGELDGGAMGGPGLLYRRDEGDDPSDLYRLYEVAGLTHNDGRLVPEVFVAADGPKPSHLPYRPLFAALLDLLIAWAEDRQAPPPNRLLSVEGRELARDEYGNARGGVRSAPLDVPVATYLPTAEYLPADSDLWQYGFGTEVPFTRERLAELYGNRESYLEQFDRRTEELVAEGWFLDADRSELYEEASRISEF